MNKTTTHKNYSHEWYTPIRWKKWANETLGTKKFFDPCPPKPKKDGLAIPWKDKAYINHPGGRGNKNKWWQKLHRELAEGNVKRYIWCGFNMQHLATLDPPIIMKKNVWLIIPDSRLRFIWGGPTDEDKKRFHGEECPNPSNHTFFLSSVKPADVPDSCKVRRL